MDERDELFARCVEALAVLASSHAFAQRAPSAGRGEVQREVSDAVAELLVANEFERLTGGGDDEADDDEADGDDARAELLERARPLLERVLAMVQTWAYDTPPPARLVELAQAALAALQTGDLSDDPLGFSQDE